MKVELTSYKLKFRVPFAIAHGTRTHTDLVFVKLSFNGQTGYGEASLPPYLEETTDSVLEFISGIELKGLDPVNQTSLILELIHGNDNNNLHAKAALDIALYDLISRIENKSISEILGIPDRHAFSTSITIGMSSEKEINAKLKEYKEFDFVKFKLGGENDLRTLELLQQINHKPFGIDANQGWKNTNEAIILAQLAESIGAQFIEQPFQKGDLEKTKQLASNVSIPIIADESFRSLNDLNIINEAFSGVNIKLSKCGGLSKSLDLINKAREMNLKILIGCMSESSCALAAATFLTSLADWVDLDSFLLTSNDPFSGLKLNGDKVSVESNIGLGVTPNQFLSF